MDYSVRCSGFSFYRLVNFSLIERYFLGILPCHVAYVILKLKIKKTTWKVGNEMIPKLNPLVKTNIELRRAILRLEALAETNMEEFNRTKAGEVLAHLKDAQNAIPEAFKNKELG